MATASWRRIVALVGLGMACGGPAVAQSGDPQLYCAMIAAATEPGEVRAINRLASMEATDNTEAIEGAEMRARVADMNVDMARNQLDAIEQKLNEARYKPVDTSQQEAAVAQLREERNARANGVRLLLEQRRALAALEEQRRGGGGVSDADLQAARDAVAAQERALDGGKPLNQLDAELAEAEWAVKAAIEARRAAVDILRIDLASAERTLRLRQESAAQARQEISALWARDPQARRAMYEVAACAQRRFQELTVPVTPPAPPPVHVVAPPPVVVAPSPVIVAAPPVVVAPMRPPPLYVAPPEGYRRPPHVVAPDRGPRYRPPERHAGPTSYPPLRRPPGDRSHAGPHTKPPPGGMTHVKPQAGNPPMRHAKPVPQAAPGTQPRAR